MSAEESYNTTHAHVLQQLEKLKAAAMQQQYEFLQTDRKNWGYVGSLNHAREELQQVIDFLTNK